MTTLRVIIDQIVSPIPGGIGRYTEELTRALVRTAPPGCNVEGIVSASPEPDYRKIHMLLPGLTGLYKSALARRELALAWRYGFTGLPSSGMVHATSLLAPLSKHDRLNEPGNQTVVTIHDTVPWTHPETLSKHSVAWHKAMAKRAQRFADAIVAPTHAVAEQLDEILGLGDRVRVIGGAASPKLVLPIDAAARARRLKLPKRYILSLGTLEPRKGIEPLIKAMAIPGLKRIPLLIAGPDGWGGLDVSRVATDAGLADGRVRTLGYLTDADLAVVLDRATVFVYPSLAEGFGLPVIEAFHFGKPVVHSDVPALVEIAAGAGLTVNRDDPEGYPERLASGITRILKDPKLAERMSTAGYDRSKAFTWRDSAEKVWQLHADL